MVMKMVNSDSRKMVSRTLLLLLTLVSTVRISSGFNVDVRSHVEYSRPPGTMFGFSVAAHKEGDVGW